MSPLQTARISALPLFLLALLSAQVARAATWAGGTGDWTSAGVNNWGLGVGRYPGEVGIYSNETAALTTAGQALIKTGDTIDHRKYGYVYSTTTTIKQTGGIFLNDYRIAVPTRYDLLGGTLTGNGEYRTYEGGVWNVDGGELGTRLSTHDGLPAGDSIFNFEGSGDGTLRVTKDGIVDLHTIRMRNLTGTALVEAVGVVPTDSDLYKRSVLYWYLNRSNAGLASVARYVFSSEGISPWKVNQLYLGTGASRASLDVDLSVFTSAGSTNFTLFDLGQWGQLADSGSFGNVSVRSGESMFSLGGAPTNLGSGQYYLDMAGGTYGKDIVLYFNNIPEPSAAAALGLGALLVFLRARSHASAKRES